MTAWSVCLMVYGFKLLPLPRIGHRMAATRGHPHCSSKMRANFTAVPIRIDGRLDETSWQKTPVYKLQLSRRDRRRRGNRFEPGEVRLLWDSRYLYIGVVLHDSYIVARGRHDQLPLFKFGDVVELFLKPPNCPWYWELYVTPNNRKSTFWLPRRSRGLKIKKLDLRVAAHCEGSLNHSGQDKEWSAEMAVPLSELGTGDTPFSLVAKWSILVARYNYRKHIHRPELSSAPQLSWANFHLLWEHAWLVLEQ